MLGLPVIFLVLGKVVAEYNITCFGFGGAGYANNVICPGSNSCCGVGANCLSSRLCHRPDDPEDLLVRGPCAVWPWDNSTCSQLCPWDEALDSPTGTFPRVNVCSDGSYCCNTFDVDCCEEKHGVWLDGTGNVLTASPTTTVVVSTWYAGSASLSFIGPTSTSSSSTSTTTSSPAPTTTTTTSAANRTPSSASQATDATKSKARTTDIGIGAAVAIAIVVIAAVIGFFLWRRSRRARLQGHRLPDTPADDLDDWLPSKPIGYEEVETHEMHEMPVEHPEMHGAAAAQEMPEESTLLRRRDSPRQGGFVELE